MLENENKYIKSAQNGNGEAFGLLYDCYLAKIYRFVFVKVNNKTIAEDLTHEVFLNAWKNLKSYAQKEFPFSSWLYQIARNEVIDFYRTRKKNISLEEIKEDYLKTQEDKDLDAEINLEIIGKLIRLLKPDQQDVIIMRFIEDLNHEEIAATLGKSAGAVRLIQHRAINSLKELYGKINRDIKTI